MALLWNTPVILDYLECFMYKMMYSLFKSNIYHFGGDSMAQMGNVSHRLMFGVLDPQLAAQFWKDILRLG